MGCFGSFLNDPGDGAAVAVVGAIEADAKPQNERFLK
jgi:hypothetical protein